MYGFDSARGPYFEYVRGGRDFFGLDTAVKIHQGKPLDANDALNSAAALPPVRTAKTGAKAARRVAGLLTDSRAGQKLLTASTTVASAWTPGRAGQLWSKGKLGQHFAKHGDEVGAASRQEYSDAAAAFGSAENAGQFVDETVGAFFYRFEPATNKVFVGTTAGQKIKTFYVWDGRADDVVINTLQKAGKL
jgi:hypothetical protein